MTQEKAKQFISAWKTELISSVVILACLLLIIFFPTQDISQKFSLNLFFFFLLPILYIKLILKKDLRNFGFNLQNTKIGIIWAIGMFFVSALIIFILIHFFDFENKYLLPAYLAQNFGIFLLYELILVNILLFIQEFFFKGFILFLFSEKFGFAVAIIQALIFTFFLLFTNDLTWKLAPLIILSFTGGVVTYKSRSFLYSYLMSLFFLIILDTYIIYLFK
jgi:membrane protease YdiL (CAAX protease family)